MSHLTHIRQMIAMGHFSYPGGSLDIRSAESAIESAARLDTEEAEPVCTCKAFDAIGQNPECPEHPWWSHDNDVLHLADLTRELGSALAAAQATFGGQH